MRELSAKYGCIVMLRLARGTTSGGDAKVESHEAESDEFGMNGLTQNKQALNDY